MRLACPVSTIPESHGCVGAGGRKFLAVRRERHAKNLGGVPEQGLDLLAGDAVPQPHGAVDTGGGEQAAVGMERDAGDRPRVAGHGEQLGMTEPLEIVPLEATEIRVPGCMPARGS